MGDEPDDPPKIIRQCSLDKPTQELVRMIFDNDMFNNAMQKLEWVSVYDDYCDVEYTALHFFNPFTAIGPIWHLWLISSQKSPNGLSKAFILHCFSQCTYPLKVMP